MDRNLYWDARGGPVLFLGNDLAAWRAKGYERNGRVADPMFANPTSYDFTLQPGSPAWAMGWKKIDMTKVGPRVAPGISAAAD